MNFNMLESAECDATVACALGVEKGMDDDETSPNGVVILFQLCEVKIKCSDLNIPKSALDRLADAAMKGERLLKNNIRKVTLDDAIRICWEAH
mgnify:CR=1 FL=1